MQRLLIVLSVLIAFQQIFAGWAKAQDSPWARPLKKCWSFDAENVTRLRTASDNDKTIILPILSGNLRALDSKHGKPIWSIKLAGSFISEILVNKKSLYLANLNTRDATGFTSLYSIDIESGVVNWTTRLKTFPTRNDIQLTIDKDRLLAFSNNGEIASIRKTDVKTQWNVTIGTSLSTNPLIVGNRILVGTKNKTLVFLDGGTGRIIDQVSLGIVPTRIAVDDSRLYIGDHYGSVRAFSLSEMRPLWKIRTGAAISSIHVIANHLLVTSNDNFAYYVVKTNGKSVWRRRLSGRIIGNVKVDKTVTVFLSSGSREALLIDDLSGKILNRVTLQSQNYFTSSPLFVDRVLILPTSLGLIAYAPKCDRQV